MTAIITPTIIPIPIEDISFDEFGKVGELSVTVVELELEDGGLNVVVHVYVRVSNK